MYYSWFVVTVNLDSIILKVAVVLLSPRLLPGSIFSGKNLSLEMLRAGWVTTYEQSGAVYGKWGKEVFLRLENEAK
jgi:endonuclease YncB( thermonuclease family)